MLLTRQKIETVFNKNRQKKMSPLSKDERKAVYEQAARELDEATTAHDTACANYPELVNRAAQADFNFEIVEAAMRTIGVDLAEYDAVNDEWSEAHAALDAVTEETLAALDSARLREYRAYRDYIA